MGIIFYSRIMFNCAAITLMVSLLLSCAHELADLNPTNAEGKPVQLSLPIILDTYKMNSSSHYSHAIYFPCTIENRNGLCQFDSGATGVFVKSCFLNSSEKWGKQKVFGASGKEKDVGRIRLNEIVIGDAVYKQIKALVGRKEKCTNKIGLIGHDLFEDVFYLDSALWTLGVSNPGITLDQNLYRNRRLFIILVEMNGTQVAALFDTGASTTFIDSRLVDQIAPNLPQLNKNRFRFQDINGMEVTVHKVVKSDLIIAGQTLSNVAIAATDLAELSKKMAYSLDMVIGMNVIKQMHWGFSKDQAKWGAKKTK